MILLSLFTMLNDNENKQHANSLELLNRSFESGIKYDFRNLHHTYKLYRLFE